MEKSFLYPQRKIPERKFSDGNPYRYRKAAGDFQNQQKIQKMIVNRGWQESTTTEEEMQEKINRMLVTEASRMAVY